MIISEMTARAISEEVGQRVKAARLNENLTQQELAQKAGISRTAVVYVEKGKAKLETFISVLIALDMTKQLELFMPVQTVSPIQFSKMKGKQRKRASGKSSDQKSLDSDQKEDLTW